MEIKRNNAASQNVLDVEVLNSPEGMEVMFDYASSRYDEASMERYRDIFGATLTALLKHASDNKATVKGILGEVYTELKLGGFFKKVFMFGFLRK